MNCFTNAITMPYYCIHTILPYYLPKTIPLGDNKVLLEKGDNTSPPYLIYNTLITNLVQKYILLSVNSYKNNDLCLKVKFKKLFYLTYL